MPQWDTPQMQSASIIILMIERIDEVADGTKTSMVTPNVAISHLFEVQ